MSPEHKRLTYALLLSLLIHSFLLSLIFGGHGLWRPGFGFPWQDRRIEEPDLRVVVVAPQVTAPEPADTPVTEPSQQASVEQPVASAPALTPSASRPPTPRQTAPAIVAEANPRAAANARTEAATGAAPAQTPLHGDQPSDAAPPPIQAPAVIAVTRPDEPTWVVPVPPALPVPVIPPAPRISIPETAMPPLRDAGDQARARIDQGAEERAVELAKAVPSKQEGEQQTEQLEAAQRDAVRQEAARVENARMEAERQEAAQQEAARQEAARQEAARQEAARQEAARQEAARQERTEEANGRKQHSRKQHSRKQHNRKQHGRKQHSRKRHGRKRQRQEAARQEAAQQEAARQEAARQEAARQEAARQEAARQEAARQEAARQEAAQAENAREAKLRAIGRQLDEEAARRDAATAAAGPSASLPLSLSSARRYRLWGRTDPNAELILYAEAWARKIQLNMTIDMVREAVKQPHTDPLVTVAIRSDGSVESVTFVLSSGVPAIDEAIRSIVDRQKPYQAFPPGLAREYDVIEIRRTWYFDVAIRLY